MNVDAILSGLNDQEVDYLLIGGMNFLVRHLPELTFDVDIWVRDDEENLSRVNRALRQLGSEWGRTETEWKAVPEDWHWLETQPLFCLTTAHGALDVFRQVLGLEGRYEQCRARAIPSQTATGMSFMALSDEDMLACQEALPPEQQKPSRIAVLKQAISKRSGT